MLTLNRAQLKLQVSNLEVIKMTEMSKNKLLDDSDLQRVAGIRNNIKK